MGDFASGLSQQAIHHGFSLLRLMESLDHELEHLNQRRLDGGIKDHEKNKLTQIKQSHLRKIQDCIQELENSGFNQWLIERNMRTTKNSG